MNLPESNKPIVHRDCNQKQWDSDVQFFPVLTREKSQKYCWVALLLTTLRKNSKIPEYNEVFYILYFGILIVLLFVIGNDGWNPLLYPKFIVWSPFTNLSPLTVFVILNTEWFMCVSELLCILCGNGWLVCIALVYLLLELSFPIFESYSNYWATVVATISL
jgi:hypothetical protein